MAPKIITSFSYTLWPALDWSAWVDGTEETGQRGWGETEQEATDDLMQQMEVVADENV